MHGYNPKDKDSDGVFMTNQMILTKIKDVSSIYYIIKELFLRDE